MMIDKLIEFTINSGDGKSATYEVEAVYVEMKDIGLYGFLCGAYPTLGVIEVSKLYTVRDNKRTYFAVSGGVIDVRKDGIFILVDTFEEAKDIDRDRAIKERDKALEIMKNSQDKTSKEYQSAAFSYKKAINRLSLIK
jgi:F-type H+-transporting ATPase subunit epsilon